MTGYSYFGVFGGDGEFEGDDVIVGDDPNKINDNNTFIFNELNKNDTDEGDDGDAEEE